MSEYISARVLRGRVSAAGRIRTPVSVRLDAVSVLEAGRPRSLVRGPGRRALSDAVAALEALCPLAAVNPPALRLDADAMPLALSPLTAVVVAARPRVHSAVKRQPVFENTCATTQKTRSSDTAEAPRDALC